MRQPLCAIAMIAPTPPPQSEDSAKIAAFKHALQQARDTIAQLMQENAALKAQPSVAMIGMACRFPSGADNLEQFWTLLCEQRDAISEVSESRWPAGDYYDEDRDVPGKMYTTKAGFLAGDITQFDAAFFGISPKEAKSLDPQQRLLLEVTWHALEDAGLVPSSLKGSRTGVFVGMSGDDYARVHRHGNSPDAIDAYAITGTTMSTAAGRIAYTLGLHGPCLTLDTACSSSLVALHLALQSLRKGECDTAIVAGVNLILMPQLHIAFSKLQALSPDGACRTFDASANGYVRSEGCAVVVLRRKNDATAEHNQIHAIIDGCAINQDGKTAGLAAPNGQAQRAVIQAALDDAGLLAKDIDYVEAHGTGTNLGDPIELEALGHVMGSEREQALRVGSVKSNIGHMEPVAGLGGLIKIALSLRYEMLPANLHFKTPNPHVDWEQLGIEVVSQPTPWPAQQKPRRAGLSAFGFSGTNAHVIISEPPLVDCAERSSATATNTDSNQPDRGVHALVLSARTDHSLMGLAQSYATHLGQTNARLADICFSAQRTRESFDQQLVVTAENSGVMIDALRAVANGQPSAEAMLYQLETAPDLTWLFTGQGAQYVGMGSALYQSAPVFRQAIDACAHELDDRLQRPLTEILFTAHEQDTIHDTANTQPALFALEYALAKLWLSWGVRPTAVVGHSVGEFAAACVAGVFSLPDAIKLISARGKLMQALPPGGAMAAVFMDEAHALKTIKALGLTDELSIACVNQFKEVVVSGDGAGLDRLLSELNAQQVNSQPLTVSHAFHSSRMQAMLAEFHEVVASVTLSLPDITLLSNITGKPVGNEICTAQYWCDHVRQTVRFHDSTQYLLTTGMTTFLEIGPHPVLATHVKAGAPTSDNLTIASSLRRGRDEWATMAHALRLLLQAGVPIDWQAWDAPYQRRQVALPGYVFDRQRFWLDRGHQAALPQPTKPAPSANLSYEISWETWHEPVLAPVTNQHWLLVGTSTTPMAQALSANGHQITCVLSMAEALDHLHAHSRALAGVAIMPGDTSLSVLATSLSDLTTLAQQMANHLPSAALWVISDCLNTTGLNAYRGAIKSISLEHGMLHGGVIDCSASGMAQASIVLTSGTAEDWLRLRDDSVEMARLKPVSLANTPWTPSAQGTYLISGGLGGLGLAVAAGLSALGARHILLLGRNQPDAKQMTAIEDIERGDTRVLTLSCDLSQPDDITALKTYLSELAVPLQGVFHLAGVMPAATEGVVSANDFNVALAGKTAGAWALHEATQHLPLDAFVMFGSISAVTGTPGIAAYAAANATLEDLAQRRRSMGLAATLVHWGPWALGAMMTHRAHTQTQQSGFRPINRDVGLTSLWHVMGTNKPQAIMVDADWQRVCDLFSIRRPQPFLNTLVQATLPVSDRETDSSKNIPSEMQALLARSPADREQTLSRSLQTLLSSVLSLPPNRTPDVSQGFFDMGMDSLTAFEFRESLQDLTGLQIATPIVFDYPSIEAMTQYLLSQLTEPDPSEPAVLTEMSSTDTVSNFNISQLSDEEIARLIDREFDSFDSDGDR